VGADVAKSVGVSASICDAVTISTGSTTGASWTRGAEDMIVEMERTAVDRVNRLC